MPMDERIMEISRSIAEIFFYNYCDNLLAVVSNPTKHESVHQEVCKGSATKAGQKSCSGVIKARVHASSPRPQPARLRWNIRG